MKLKLDVDQGDITEHLEPITEAALAAFDDAGKLLQERGRAHIRSAGFSPNVQNAWAAQTFPNAGTSAPAVYGHHKFHFSAVFEKGSVIHGAPLLWLPLPGTPKFIAGKRTTPQLWVNIVGPLSSVRRHSGGKPLLVGKLPGSNESVPLFVGVPQVSIRKRLDLQRVAEGVADELPALFEKHLKEG